MMGTAPDLIGLHSTTSNPEGRSGDWFLSFKGRQLWPCDVRPEDLDIEEIAHGLSMICRFGGQSREFYSVAQHSVLVALRLPIGLQLCGLLHDAPEAFLGDVIRPLKRHVSMESYGHVEAKAWAAFARRYDLPAVIPPAVKEVDNRMLITERRDLLPEHPWPWKEDEQATQPYDFHILPWRPKVARRKFLAEFERLTGAGPWAGEGGRG